MTSAGEVVAKSPAVGCFAKVHDVFTLTGSSYEKSDTDCPPPVSKNSNTGILPVSEPTKATIASDVVGGLDRPEAANTNSESDGSERIQDDGPSTPMRYLPRPAYVHVDTPDSADSLPSLSLGTGSSLCVDKVIVKQEVSEVDNDNLLSLSLSKTDGGLQSMVQSDSINMSRVLDTPGTSKMAVCKENEMQQPNLYQQLSFVTHSPRVCSTVNTVVSLQSSTNMSRRSTKCLSLHTNTKQEISFGDSQRQTEAVVFPLISPRSLKRVPCTFRQPASWTLGIVQCEDALQESQLKHKAPVSTTNLCYHSTTSSNAQSEALSYMPILQTPMVTNTGGQRLVSNEDNLCLNNECSPVTGKRRKLDSHKQPGADSASALAEVNQCFLKAREQAEDAENPRVEAERLSSIKRRAKMMRSPNCDCVSKDCFKNHTVFARKVDTLKSLDKPADLRSTSNIANPGHLPASSALKLTGSGIINSAVSLGHVYSLRPDVHSYSNSEHKMCDNSSPATAKADQQTIGKSVEQTLDGQPQPLGLRPLTFPAYAPMPAALPIFSSGGPSLPQHMKHQAKFGDFHLVKKQTPQRMPSSDSDWGKFLGLSATPCSSLQVVEPDSETLLPYQKRFVHLQAFLKQCDEPDQKYLKTLRSLSSAARSGHAVDLETRAIMLSLEEGKELHRMKMLNVFAKDSPRSANAASAAPQGVRLPTLVAPRALSLVSNP